MGKMKSKVYAIQAKYLEEHLASLNLPKDTVLHISYDKEYVDTTPQSNITYILNAEDTEELIKFVKKIPVGMTTNVQIQHFSCKK